MSRRLIVECLGSLSAINRLSIFGDLLIGYLDVIFPSLVAVGRHIGLTGPLRVLNTANQGRLPAKVIERDGFAIPGLAIRPESPTNEHQGFIDIMGYLRFLPHTQGVEKGRHTKTRKGFRAYMRCVHCTLTKRNGFESVFHFHPNSTPTSGQTHPDACKASKHEAVCILVPDPPPLTQIGHGVKRIRSHVRDHPPGNGHHIPELAQVAADGYPQSTTATTTEPGATCGAWSSLRTLWANLSLPEVAQTLPSSPNLGPHPFATECPAETNHRLHRRKRHAVTEVGSFGLAQVDFMGLVKTHESPAAASLACLETSPAFACPTSMSLHASHLGPLSVRTLGLTHSSDDDLLVSWEAVACCQGTASLTKNGLGCNTAPMCLRLWQTSCVDMLGFEWLSGMAQGLGVSSPIVVHGGLG
ncbi:hypothetical protein NEUTE1DRAFT_38409 [Neurospora tetrasperma FGSC 2508]|uniref:Uncharacterized protein n=1 Tax=Neurospora tetrasperma (strain FGSC 2508 / ATCC MYA-4615 / P0657) TaxID=510951 RepID=F8MIV8_NEUT8|nr:uncharacterized protein NEUTE1DRAFT_38409 [Neurospora tetrasperma FGSC 2508]EGO59855.1 hypothetical protein NEUTE1DRAFT_38409 [Neurospora tetrasperma FGSC 2508]EGZ74004.1 hypothetical protein NEUTE2DRAFT_60841 [Neurospora tetrasperma FGSC 2509]